jgi:hypothetical protein
VLSPQATDEGTDKFFMKRIFTEQRDLRHRNRH